MTIVRILAIAGAFLAPFGMMDRSVAQVAPSGAIIEEIAVEGTARVDPETVLSYMAIKPGDPFSASKLDQSLKSLFATGLFADVIFRRQESKLVIQVVENPIINRVAFEGNDILDDDVMAQEVTLRPRVIYTRTKVQNDVKRLLTIYRQSGRFAATIEAKIIQLPQNRVDLVFEINEGDTSDIKSIRFVGNRHFDDGDLRGVISTRETAWFRFFSSDDVYDPDRLTLDRERLRRFYLEEGYPDFRVVSAVAELTPDREDFFITFTVDEGERYKYGEIALDTRLKGLDNDALQEALKIETGDWYDSIEVEEAVDLLTDQIGNLGYAFVEISPKIERDRADRKIDLTFEINEGPRVFVERIDIVGNVRTVDKVIRRELRMVEGDAFNSAKMQRSQERIRNLGFFENATVERLPGSSPDKAVIRAEVSERSTGSLNIGLGFSTDAGPLVDFSVSETNFLGKGYAFGVSARIAGSRNDIDLSFTDPYFLDRELTAGFDLFKRTRDNQDSSSFDSDEFGFKLRTGYSLTEYLSQRWFYELTNKAIENVDADSSISVRSQEGSAVTSQISHGITYDRRDSRIFTTEGYVLGMDNDLSGLGGDKYYFRTSIFGEYYQTLFEKIIFNVSAKAGYIVALRDEISLIDRFFVGGSEVRGFASAGIGPRDIATDDALGGEIKYTGTIQASFPLGLPEELGMRARVFTDFGSLWQLEDTGGPAEDSRKLRISSGVGITWRTPLGPVGIDFASALAKESYDETETVRLNFGTQF